MESTDLMANHNFFTCHFAIPRLKEETNNQRIKKKYTGKP